MALKNNSCIISLASNTAMKYTYEAYDEINSFRPIRYIADRQRREKKKASKRVRLITALVKPPSLEATHRGSSRTLLHHPHRACIRPDSCVRHSLRVESTDARYPAFFFISSYLLRMRCVSKNAIPFFLTRESI